MAHTDSDTFMHDALFWANYSESTANTLDIEDVDEATKGDDLMDAEVRMLTHVPTTPEEMIIQLEIICEDLNSGNRSDRLDVHAIRNVQHALLNLKKGEDDRFARFNAVRATSELRYGQNQSARPLIEAADMSRSA